MSNREIVEQYLIDNRDTFYRIAYIHVQSEADAFDIVSEATIKAITKCHSLRNPVAIKSWFYRILIRCVYDSTNLKKKINVCEDFSDQIMDSSNQDQLMTISTLELIQKLPTKYQTVIILRYYEDLSFKEMASILHLPQSTIKSRVKKAIELLRNEVNINE